MSSPALPFGGPFSPGREEPHDSPAISSTRATAPPGSTPASTNAPDFWSPSAVWTLDDFVLDPGYLPFQEELRSLIFKIAATAAPTREATPDDRPSVGEAEHVHTVLLSEETGSPAASTREASPARFLLFQEPNIPNDVADLQAQTSAILSRGRHVEYMANYVSEIAPWLDMFDSERAFGIQVPVLARSSPALLYSVLALSARHMERKAARARRARDATGSRSSATAGHSFDSLELYQEAIRLVGPLLEARDPAVIPVCTVLCVTEMMSASAPDWRRHLEGCAALFEAFGVHGFTGGLPQAVFWCYARMDLCGALISDGLEDTLVPIHRWLPPGAELQGAGDIFRSLGSPDMCANYSVFLCSKACGLIAARTRYVELGDTNGCTDQVYRARWLSLWLELQAWLDQRPLEMCPIQTIETSPFPRILFVHWAAISSNQLYHTACILLLGLLPRFNDPGERPTGLAGSAIYHAKRVCGISQTNLHQGCLNNAIQPLWIAGRLLSHPTEHSVIVKLLRNIEATTGWGTCWRIPDLEAAWGYQAGRSQKFNRQGKVPTDAG
ncbi:hypothetical protein GGTG_03538 [Gaeumannomyces tritici R3-111a-1]|uniref:C6 zinc finger domain-containing protein n=1 Tax=Gaeumannomyces tritici (strain R3-111a-1) TaxID=644352 RepID=J3NQI1_GAET3|nr:hypothetical protein GGTG_03538 [Gaeumannomyces tritici R3-111a-1]EJT78437.1 hypothetical protein GGTG_03538 [Gaeumannomyces tritici R3-111a-1]